MRRRPSHRLFPWLCCLFLQLGCPAGGPPPTLSGFHGCADLRHEPGATRDDGGTYVCAVAEEPGPLRLWVQAAGPAGVALARRGAGLRGAGGLTAQLTADDRLLIEGDRAALPQVLTVTGRSVLGGAARGPAVHLRVVRQELLSVEVMADAARDQNAIAQGIADLRAAAETPQYRTDPVARARLLHRLADLELTAAQHSDAVRHFEQALALAEPAGLTSVVANAARLMAFEHYTLSRDIPRALAILEKYAATIHLIELESVLELGHRGVYAQERGDLSAALRYLSTALAAIKDMGEDDSRRGIAVMYTVLLAQQGLTQKAEAEIHKLRTEAERPDGAFAVCERMRLLGNLGWARILMQESHSPGAQDPIPLLDRALFYRPTTTARRTAGTSR